MALALVTGASSGFGAAYARRLARDGCDVALIARSTDRLEEVAADVRAQGRLARVLAVDLATQEGLLRVERDIAEGPPVFLVHAAGFGVPGPLTTAPLQEELALVAVQVTAAVRLCRAVLPSMSAARSGRIVLVSSIGAFLVHPGDSVYCGSKAFLVRFAQALAGEAPRGVAIQALCPGFVRTRFHTRPAYAGVDVAGAIPAWAWSEPDAIVDSSLRALRGRRVVHVPGVIDRLLVAAAALGLGRFLASQLDRRL